MIHGEHTFHKSDAFEVWRHEIVHRLIKTLYYIRYMFSNFKIKTTISLKSFWNVITIRHIYLMFVLLNVNR